VVSTLDAADDEQTLAAAGLATDGPALLEFFRARTRVVSEADELMALVRQLGDSAAEVRARASAGLVSRGATAIPVLRHTVNDLSDPELARRARQCLARIEGPAGAALPMAAARLVAMRKPAGAAAVLLGYLPFADDQAVAEQVGLALAAVAYPEGKPDTALLQALEDPVPLRRAAAGEALCRKDRPEQWPAVRKLLRDPKPGVRLRAALALAGQQDAESIPVLIGLIAELPPAQRNQAEEVLQQLAGEWAPNLSLPGDDNISRRIRRDAWAAWWRNTGGPALLAEFRKRTLTPAGQEKIQALIGQLGHDSFAIRERAVTDLVAYGYLATPFLREALRGTDPERTQRAKNCLQVIAQSEENHLPVSAPRLLVVRKPAGALEVLLAYLPYAEGEPMVREVESALAALAFQDGKPHAALVGALDDQLPLRRAAAAQALVRAQGGNSGKGKADTTTAHSARKLLHDGNPMVRARVALALAIARDREAVPVLISALADLSSEEGAEAQEALYLLAGDQSPSVTPGEDAASRRKYRDAWSAWWTAHGATADLARLDAAEHFLGYTLLVQVQQNTGIGRVLELGRDGKPRWQIDGLQYPVDAYVLGCNRVLITECNGQRVSERDLKGNILWQKQGFPSQPVNAQRLRNGNTFIATVTGVMEVDRHGKELYSHALPGQNLAAAYKSRSGVISCLTQQGTCVQLDATGKQIRSFPTGRAGGWTSAIDVSANGRVLIAEPNQNLVLEFDAQGKTVWQAKAPGATTATRLSNGHTLVASVGLQTVSELDGQGKVVWEYKDGYGQFRARRR
jgi:HEAT repeat protein